MTSGSSSGAIWLAWVQSNCSMSPRLDSLAGRGSSPGLSPNGRVHSGSMPAGLTIGEFATLTHLSVRTLRRYHESGLLVPATVDATTGYRYYAAAQIPSAQVIHQLRQLDVPLAEVKQILATDDPLQRTDLVTAHLRRLEDTLDRTRA